MPTQKLANICLSRRLIVCSLLLILLATLFPLNPAFAINKQAECLELLNQNITSNSSTNKFQVDLYSICPTVPKEYEMIKVEIVGFSNQFSSSYCNALLSKSAASFGKLYIGTLICTFPSSVPAGSPRIGATSTTLRIFFDSDSSSKFVTYAHYPISETKVPGSKSPTLATPSPQSTSQNLGQKGQGTEISGNCVSGDNFIAKCFSGSFWTYTICYISKTGELQENVAGKWKRIKKFAGTIDRNACSSGFAPYLISITLQSQSNRLFRAWFYSTKEMSASYSRFQVKFKA